MDFFISQIFLLAIPVKQEISFHKKHGFDWKQKQKYEGATTISKAADAFRNGERKAVPASRLLLGLFCCNKVGSPPLCLTKIFNCSIWQVELPNLTQFLLACGLTLV